MWVRPATLMTVTRAEARTAVTPVAEASEVLRARTLPVRGMWVVKITVADAPRASVGMLTQAVPFRKLSGAFLTAVRAARRIVVKIGTGVLTGAAGRFDRVRFDSLCEELYHATLDREVVVVSSGAVALGVERLGLATRPKDIVGKQAAAAPW